MANGNSTNQENSSILGELGRQAAQVGGTAFGLPRRIERTLDQLEQGDLRMRVRSIETERILRRISNAQIGTNFAVLAGTFVLSATILFVQGYLWLAVIAALVAVVPAFSLIRLLIRLDRYERMN